jgi:hypothetical protein
MRVAGISGERERFIRSYGGFRASRCPFWNSRESADDCPGALLMYFVTEELLVRAHRVKSSPWAMPLFFVAFLLYLVTEELLGP